MLRLITGKAGAGKTAAIMNEIAQAAASGRGGRIVIVPEQYSHEAERELCATAGDRASLYAEVVSFTRLARNIAAETGGAGENYLDKGGRLLCMTRALNHSSPALKLYARAKDRPLLQQELLRAIDEIKSAGADAARLTEIAEHCEPGLSAKLKELAVIINAYDAVVANGHADPSDRLTKLAGNIKECGLGPGNHVYVDGFTDFTRQELNVLYALMEKGVELTVCLTMLPAEERRAGKNRNDELFSLSRLSAVKLRAKAEELGIETVEISASGSGGKSEAVTFFADNFFGFSSEEYSGQDSPPELFTAVNMKQECEFAAARAIRLVSEGCRWRDIAIAIRGFGDYEATLRSVFANYGVPLFTAEKSDLMSRPLPALIAELYEITSRGWESENVISYMRTGLAGLDRDECDILENYIYTWQLRGSAWKREQDWRQHPDGFGVKFTDEANGKLEKINEIRRRLAQPVLNFEARGKEAETVLEHAENLSAFMEELELPVLLKNKADDLMAHGHERVAAEYRQLWRILTGALEQTVSVLGDLKMNSAGFGELFTGMLSGYDVGTIPVAMDRVSAGDFDRMRRRSIKHLIILGADAARLPAEASAEGIFSGDERSELADNMLLLDSGEDHEIWREFTLIYNCLSLPSESLAICCSHTSEDGAKREPCFLYNTARNLFNVHANELDPVELRSFSRSPALSLAANALRGGGSREQAAKEFFESRVPERMEQLRKASSLARTPLSKNAVSALYGDKIKLSASRMDSFSQCGFAYFCRFGLELKKNEPAVMDSRSIGTFMHDILEKTGRRVKDLGGFKKVSNEQLGKIADEYIEAYVKTELQDFAEKNKRFEYLFRRTAAEAKRVVINMAEELRVSDFEPLSFELDFGKEGLIPPTEEDFRLTGIADRIDGWVHDGRLYLRVVDYKTGSKSFRLTDILYGLNLQMLLYLFTIENGAAKLYGKDIPEAGDAEIAGVIYIHAADPVTGFDNRPEETELRKKKNKDLMRKGLVLDDAELMRAWEHAEDGQNIYLPVTGKNRAPRVASLEQMGLLAKHIDSCISDMTRAIKAGSIEAAPVTGCSHDACRYCEFRKACFFEDGQNGEQARKLKNMKDPEVWEALRKEAEENA